jgi:hypothetical protein
VSVLRSIEQKIEGLFEGVFGRAFRTHVQPVELARKLVKEMDDHKSVSVSRIYVPNEYSVWLAPGDRAQFAEYETSLRGELQDYLAEHARREGYVMLTPPAVVFHSDEDLAVGDFGIATRMVQPEGHRPQRDEPAAQVEPGHTMVYKPRATPQETQAVTPEELGMEPEIVTLSHDSVRYEITKRRVLIGRSKECDIQLSDPNVSRRHAELRQEGATYWIVDLQSTNGIEVNGERQERAKLENGDRITLGSTELTFGREVP